MAPLVAGARYADSRDDSIDGLEAARHRSLHSRHSHLLDPANHRHDGHNRQAESFEHVGRCLRCSAPSCLPSSPSVPSSLPSPAIGAFLRAVVAPFGLSSHIAESRPQEGVRKYLRIRRTRRSRADWEGCESWRTPAASSACVQHMRTALMHCVWACEAEAPVVWVDHPLEVVRPYSLEGEHRLCLGWSGYPVLTQQGHLVEREDEREQSGGAGAEGRSPWDRRPGAEGTARFPGRAKPSCLPSRTRK